jgi:hypothetical protein
MSIRGPSTLTLMLLLPVSVAAQPAADAPVQAAGDGSGLSAEAQAALAAAMAAQTAGATGAAGVDASGAGAAGVKVDTAWVLDIAAAAFSDREPLQAGGHDPTRRGFTLQQLELSLGTSIDPFLRLDANLVFSLFGVEIEEAYASSTALPGGFQLRAGQFLTRFGRINQTHLHAWSFVDQAIAIGKVFGSEGNRGLGAELSWLAPLPWYAELSLAAQQGAGDCCARSMASAESDGVDSWADLVYTADLNQFFALSDDVGLAWGVSAQTSQNGSGFQNRTDIYGTDLYLRYRPLDSQRRIATSLTVEAMLRSREVPGDLLRDAGGYAQLVQTWSPEWETGIRYELFSGVEGDPLDPEWTNHRDRSTAQLTYYPSHFSRIRLQGSLDRPTWRDDTIWAAMLALELVGGDHGAHAY